MRTGMFELRNVLFRGAVACEYAVDIPPLPYGARFGGGASNSSFQAPPLEPETQGMLQVGEPSSKAAETPDTVLLYAVAGGDLEAFGELYSRYAGVVRAFLKRRIRDPEWAEDLSQEIFAKIWQKADTYQTPRGTVSQWIFGIARYGLFDALRKVQCLGRAVEGVLARSAESASVHGGVGSDEWEPGRDIRLKRAVDGLPPEQRRAVELVYFEGYTLKECALRTGTPVGTVKWRISRAHRSLKQALVSEASFATAKGSAP